MNSPAQKPEISTAERLLVLVLQVSGVMLLIALIPAVMPFAWMDDIHQRLGLGRLPDMPIVGYLTRSLSALYALHGGLVFFVSLDVRRYLPVVRCLFVLGILFGAGMLALDLTVAMPSRWAYCEGPFIIVMSGLVLWLASKVPQVPAAQ